MSPGDIWKQAASPGTTILFSSSGRSNRFPPGGSLFSHLPGLPNLEHLAGGVRRQRLFRYGGKGHKPDLLFRDRQGTSIVVELKKAEPIEGVSVQLDRYLRAVAADGHAVEGLLITPRPRSGAGDAITGRFARMAETDPVRWIWYEARVDLVDASLMPAVA